MRQSILLCITTGMYVAMDIPTCSSDIRGAKVHIYICMKHAYYSSWDTHMEISI